MRHFTTYARSLLMSNVHPYPRLHCLISAYAPLMSRDKASHESFSCDELTTTVMTNSDALLTKCKASLGKYMSACLMYRGDITPSEVRNTMTKIKSNRSVQFVDWCPTGFKCGINGQAPFEVEHGDIA